MRKREGEGEREKGEAGWQKGGDMVKGSNLFWGCNYDVTMLQKCCVHVSYIIEMYNIKSCGEQCTTPNKAVMTLAHHFRNSYLQLGGVWYMLSRQQPKLGLQMLRSSIHCAKHFLSHHSPLTRRVINISGVRMYKKNKGTRDYFKWH